MDGILDIPFQRGCKYWFSFLATPVRYFLFIAAHVRTTICCIFFVFFIPHDIEFFRSCCNIKYLLLRWHECFYTIFFFRKKSSICFFIDMQGNLSQVEVFFCLVFKRRKNLCVFFWWWMFFIFLFFTSSRNVKFV